MSDSKQKEIMELNNHAVHQIKKIYRNKKGDILSRLKDFEKIWSDKNDEEIFTELAFCLLTPQSKAKSCWDAVLNLKEHDLLLSGNTEQVRKGLACVRFKNKKAEYIIRARKLFTPRHPPLNKGGRGGGVGLNKKVSKDFHVDNHRVSIKPLLKSFSNIYECRKWLANNIDGLGYKEASHFLRNIGLGEEIAILDRHILRNLKETGVIEEIPKSLSRAKYMQVEKQMIGFARQIRIPVSHLDLLFWSKETGEIFK
jgi:N-glycosylase/DNA lyase